MNRRRWIAVAVLVIGGLWFLNSQSSARQAAALRLGMSRAEINAILGADHHSLGISRLRKKSSPPRPMTTKLYYGRAATLYNEAVRRQYPWTGLKLRHASWPIELTLEDNQLREIRVRGRIIDPAN